MIESPLAIAATASLGIGLPALSVVVFIILVSRLRRPRRIRRRLNAMR